MNPLGINVLWIAINVVLAMLGTATLLALVRLVRGPTSPDRVVALDLIGVICVAVVALYAIATQQTVYLRVAIVLALIAFFGTVAFALYVQKTGQP